MNDFKIALTLTELDHPDKRVVTREIDGSNFIMDDGEYAMTKAEQEAEIQYWIDETGKDQHNSTLRLDSYTVERYV